MADHGKHGGEQFLTFRRHPEGGYVFHLGDPSTGTTRHLRAVGPAADQRAMITFETARRTSRPGDPAVQRMAEALEPGFRQPSTGEQWRDMRAAVQREVEAQYGTPPPLEEPQPQPEPVPEPERVHEAPEAPEQSSADRARAVARRFLGFAGGGPDLAVGGMVPRRVSDVVRGAVAPHLRGR